MVDIYSRAAGIAQFNKLNKEFITVLGPVEDRALLNNEFYLYVDVLIDDTKETIVGTYDNFQIVPRDSLPRQVTEDELNLIARAKIVEKYPLEVQLSILGSVLEQLATTANIDCADLIEMNDYIAEVRRVNKLRKEFFASSPDYAYLSTEELNALFEKQMEGGIAQFVPTASTI